MAFRSVFSAKIPLVIILGATGTGKTKLSVELAQKFGTEIISADSMQIYKGLDVVTAKASKQERDAAPHHLLDILEPHQMFTVVDFRNRALKIIDNLTEQRKIPIVVGGTNYYIESIVYKILVEDMDDAESLLWDKSRRKRDLEPTEVNEDDEGSLKKRNLELNDNDSVVPDTTGDFEGTSKPKTKDTCNKEVDKVKLQQDVDNEKNFTNEEIHQMLHKIDPVMAARLHPNNRRKVLRLARLRSTSRSQDRSRSVTPSRPTSLRTSTARRALIMSLSVGAKRKSPECVAPPPKRQALVVNQTPSGSMRVLDSVPIEQTPGGTVRLREEEPSSLRSIEVWLKTGRLHSQALAEQKLSEGQLRRPGVTVILWLKCEKSIHDERLNARVDSMLQEGLIQELLDFHERHNKQRIQDGQPPDYTKGVFQTLGFKEFHEYLMLSEEQRSTEEGKKLLAQSIENMKIGTRRYARRQNKMIKGRFLTHPTREVPPIYELDTTDLSQWDVKVSNKAIEIIESYLNEEPCPYKPVHIEIDEETKNIDGNSRNYCSVCNRLIIGDKTYEIHLNSYRHTKVLKKKKKEQEKGASTEDNCQ